MSAPEKRPLSKEERAIVEWLLTHATPPALSYVSQLDTLDVCGQCKCGCPTVHFCPTEATAAAEPRDNPVGEAFAKVHGHLVGVMLLQREGLLTCLEVYDLSEIEHPYGLPEISTFEPAVWGTSPPLA